MDVVYNLQYTRGQGGESMKIGDFSKIVGVSISTLRYYEEQGFLRIDRINGIRDYKTEDVGFVQFIKRLKDMGMPLVNIKRYADLRYMGNGTIPERMALLEKHREYIRSQIAIYETYLQNIDDKLELYSRWKPD